MFDPVLRKLERFGHLPDEDKALLDGIVARRYEVPARCDLVCQGDVPTFVHLVGDGFACLHKRLLDGRRQIVAFLIPGDFVDPNALMFKSTDYSISTLAPSKIVKVPKESILAMLERPALARALSMAASTDSAILRERITSLGQRSAEHRIAHLFCELHARFRDIGIGSEGAVPLPLTQTELSETVGLSLVHTNRTLKHLSDRNLVKFKRGILEVIDARKLANLCGFRPTYLHLSNDIKTSF